MAEAYLGLDVGTSAVKGVLVDAAGVVLARGSAPVPVRAAGRAHEQDPLDYLAAVRSVADQCRVAGPGGPAARLAGIGVVGQTPTLVVVDAAGEPLRPALTWRDGRPAPDAAALAAALPDPTQLLGTANLWDTSQLPAKLAFLARTEPATLERARWVLEPKDFVAFRLTGAATSDPWSMKGLCSVRSQAPATEVFASVGARVDLLPPLHEPWELAGAVTPPGAAELGLPAGVGVAVGWSDALAGMLAVGAATGPRSFVLTGTSDIAGTSSAADPGNRAGVYLVPGSCSPLPISYGPTQSSGASLLWLARLTGRDPGDLVSAAEHAADTPACFTPYLRGERAPLWSAAVRAGLTGLAEDDGVAEVALAVLRGVAASGRHVLAASTGDAIGEVHLAGSNVADPGWIRARHDVFAVPLVLHTEPQPTALGAAMLARAATAGEPPGAAYDRLAGATVRVDPPAGSAAAADGRYRRYLRAVAAALADAG